MKTPDAPADTRLVDCDDGALARLPAFLRERLPGAPALVVADPATWNAAGRDLWGALREARRRLGGCRCGVTEGPRPGARGREAG